MALKKAREAAIANIVLVMGLLAVGRAGEAGLASWDAAWWCGEMEAVVFDWPELNTGEFDPMNFFNDAKDFSLDFYILMCFHYSCGGGVITDEESANCAFPSLAQRPNSVNKYTTDKMKVAAAGVEELKAYLEFIAATSCRSGAAITILEHPEGTLLYMVMMFCKYILFYILSANLR